MKTPISALLAAALVGGVVGAVVALAGAWRLGAFDAPAFPVAVVNLGGLIRADAHGGKIKKADVQAGFKKMRALGEALAAKGYLVLDAESVVDAPADFYVPRRETGIIHAPGAHAKAGNQQ